MPALLQPVSLYKAIQYLKVLVTLQVTTIHQLILIYVTIQSYQQVPALVLQVLTPEQLWLQQLILDPT
jgi:hypothetical protein